MNYAKLTELGIKNNEIADKFLTHMKRLKITRDEFFVNAQAMKNLIEGMWKLIPWEVYPITYQEEFKKAVNNYSETFLEHFNSIELVMEDSQSTNQVNLELL